MPTLQVLDRPYPSGPAEEFQQFIKTAGKDPPAEEKAAESPFSNEQMVRAQYSQFAQSIIKKCRNNTPIDSIRAFAARGVARMDVNGAFPPLTDASDFLARESPPLPPEIIRHVLVPQSKMLLGGASKMWKTWTLLDINISVACGCNWWGFPTHCGKVCYINLELQAEYFERRFRKICEVKNIKPEPGMFHVWNLRGYAKPMTQLVRILLPELHKHHFTLVTIDPMYKTLPPYRGSENDSAVITQLLNEAESIIVETGASVLFASHFSKGNQAGKESMDRVAGSGAWARDADTLLTMTQHEQYDCFSVEATLRNMPRIKPFVVQWDYPLFVRQDELDPEQLKKKGGRPAKDPQLLLDQLSVAAGREPGDVISWMKKHHDWSRATVYRVKDQLVERGAFRIENDLWYRTPN
jgi:hypothetical protein